MEQLFLSTEFKKRLTRFENELTNYRKTGNIGSLIPTLYSLATYCWCKSPVIKKKYK